MIGVVGVEPTGKLFGKLFGKLLGNVGAIEAGGTDVAAGAVGMVGIVGMVEPDEPSDGKAGNRVSD